MRPWWASAGLCVLGACAHPAPPASVRPVGRTVGCAPGDTALVRDVVYFGRNRPGGGIVADDEWWTFLDDVVTPRFPAGLTIVEAVGQWRGASGAVEHERSEVVTFLHAGDPPAREAVRAIAAEYKRRFAQEAVLRERSMICAKFE